MRDDRPDLGFPGAWINLGTQQVHLIEGVAPPNLGQHFAIRVGDLDAAVNELRSKGFEVRDPVTVGATARASSKIRRNVIEAAAEYAAVA